MNHMITHQGNRFPWGREQAALDSAPNATVSHPQASLTWGVSLQDSWKYPRCTRKSPSSKVSPTNQGRGPGGNDGAESEG